MASPEPDVPVSALRDAARDAVVRSSLRSVARIIGMTAPGLQAFLDGTTPQARTLRKLREWYVREAVASREPDKEAILACLALLLDGFENQRKRRAGERQLLRALVEIYQQARLDVPGWLMKMTKPGRS